VHFAIHTKNFFSLRVQVLKIAVAGVPTCYKEVMRFTVRRWPRNNNVVRMDYPNGAEENGVSLPLDEIGQRLGVRRTLNWKTAAFPLQRRNHRQYGECGIS
jgi:hypothetical protein